MGVVMGWGGGWGEQIDFW